jgi:hypothetical protein
MAEASDVISINFKVLSAVQAKENFQNYKPENGISIYIKKGTILRECLLKAGFKYSENWLFYLAGKSCDLKFRIDVSSEITCTGLILGG